jgi:fused signal recognition particle receptor
MIEEKSGWFARLKSGLSKTTDKISTGITKLFTHKKLDDLTLEELEELLIEADLGASVAAKIAADFGKQKFEKTLSAEDVRSFLAISVANILAPVTSELVIDRSKKPHVVVVVGVNGNGKTTTIGKIAQQLKGNGYSVMLAAADTFRAAAVEQLQVWGTRTGTTVITGDQNADPASVAYRAYEQARSQNMDVLIIDTAGRLQNKSNLMAELKKILAVLKKIDESAPHTILQVLDATTGQNALSQVEVFKQMAQVNALIVTKLDGTAKAGVVVALADRFKLPIVAVGVGEGIDDLRPFNASDFARNLVGL